jgi:hypothetical protein
MANSSNAQNMSERTMRGAVAAYYSTRMSKPRLINVGAAPRVRLRKGVSLREPDIGHKYKANMLHAHVTLSAMITLCEVILTCDHLYRCMAESFIHLAYTFLCSFQLAR